MEELRELSSVFLSCNKAELLIVVVLESTRWKRTGSRPPGSVRRRTNVVIMLETHKDQYLSL